MSLRWLLLLQSKGSRAHVGSGLAALRLGSQAQELWLTGLVAPWHAESSCTRDQTRVPCIGRRILSHWTTREVLKWFFFFFSFIQPVFVEYSVDVRLWHPMHGTNKGNKVSLLVASV